MKRILTYILCLILVFLFVACKKENKKELTLDCQIKQAFIDREWKDGNFNDLQVRYVYSFGETHAVFVDCALFNYTTAFTSFQIGNYPFNFNDGQAMYVFKDGVLATLEEAYAQNMLFEEQWKVLHNIWKELNPIAYAD